MAASAFFKNGSLIESFASTVTSGGTLTLTSSSDAYQVFTGTSSHTMKLPDATTMILNQKFEVINTSSSTITVQNNSNITIGTVSAGQTIIFRVTDIGTANGSFDITTAGSAGSGGLSTTESAQFGSLAAKGFSAQSRILKLNPEELAGDYPMAVAALPTASAWSQGVDLNGYGYSISGLDSANTTILTLNTRYSDDHNAWLARAVIPSGRQGGAALNYANAVYLFCGSSTNSSANAQTTNQKYVDSTNTWSTVGAFPNARMAQLAFTLTKAHGMGGTDSGGSTGQSEHYVYDSTLDSWAARASMLTARAQGSAFVIDGFGYIAHGSPDNGSVLYNTTAKYSEAINIWNSVSNLSSGRYHTIGNSGNGFGYSAGGYISQSSGVNDEYSAALNQWKVKVLFPNLRHSSNIGFTLNGVPHYPGGRQLPASINVALTDKYIASSLFNLGSLKKHNSIPTSVAVAVVLGSLTPNVPVQVRTSGNEWKNFMSGASSLKHDETASIKWAESSEMFACGGGSPQLASTELHNPTTVTWLTRTNMITARGGGWHFPIDGYGYVGGAGGGGNNLNERYNIQLNSWASRTAAPVGRDRTRSHTLNGFGYVYSTSGSYSNNQLKYNATLDSWSIPSSTYTTANGYALGYALMGYGYVVGGENGGGSLTQNAQYSDVLDTFTNRAAVHAVSQSAGVSFEGLGYVTGGYNGSDISTVSAYNPGTNAWTAKTNLVTAQRAQGNDFEDNGIYAISGTASPTSNFKFNPYSNVWSASLSALNASREYPMLCKPGYYRNYEVRVAIPAAYAGVSGGVYVSAANVTTNHNVGAEFNLQGYGYMVNGFIGGGSQSSQNDRYDEVTNSWMQVASNSNATYSTLAFTLEGRGHRVAGQTVATHEAYSPEQNIWISRTNGPGVADWAQGSTLQGRGYALGNSASNNAQYYRNTTDAWISVTGPGAGLTSARWSQGDYIFAAGSDGTSTACQRYNAVTDAWASSASMNVARRNHAVLFKGRGYIAGSLTSYVTSTEFYNHDANFWFVGPTLLTGVGSQAVFSLAGGSYSAAGYNGAPVTSNQRMSDSIKQAVLSAGLTVS